jgi:NAD(P)H-hydrate epimerase
MGLLKRGLVLYPGADLAGAVRIADLGIPPEVIEEEKIRVSLIESVVEGSISRRKADAHKGSFGHLMIVAGSPGKAGAAVMAARAAVRSGAGLVSVAAPNGLVPIIQSQIAEAMCIPSAESIEATLGMGAEEELVKAAAPMSACAIGPGLSTHHETVQSVRNLAQRLTIPMVIDADGLNAFAGHTELFKRIKAPVILTPHPGEMGRLIGKPTVDVQKDRINIAAAFADAHKVILVLKGAHTIVALPGGGIYVNTTGNPGMASGGTGDVLTGMIGSLLAQGYSAADAACLGVYLHGMAGDMAAGEKGEAGMIAGDVIEKIPEAIKKNSGDRN